MAVYALSRPALRRSQWFIDGHLEPLRLDALHHAQNTAGAEIVRSRRHGEAMDADDARPARDYLGRDEILTRRVRRHDRLNQILRHILVIGEHLLGVLGQADRKSKRLNSSH